MYIKLVFYKLQTNPASRERRLGVATSDHRQECLCHRLQNRKQTLFTACDGCCLLPK